MILPSCSEFRSNQTTTGHLARRGVLALFACGFSFVTVGCRVSNGSGNPGEETRELDLEAVREVSVCCGFELTLTLGTSDSVRVEGDDNLIDNVAFDRVGNRLEIEWDDPGLIYVPTAAMHITLELEELSKLEVSGGSMVNVGAQTTDGPLSVDLSGGSRGSVVSSEAGSVTLGLSGGSQLEIGEVTAEEVSLDVSGGSQLEISAGATPTLVALVSGASQLRVSDFASVDATVDISGGSTVQLQASGNVTGAVSGGSQFDVSGGAEVDVENSGGSTVTQ